MPTLRRWPLSAGLTSAATTLALGAAATAAIAGTPAVAANAAPALTTVAATVPAPVRPWAVVAPGAQTQADHGSYLLHGWVDANHRGLVADEVRIYQRGPGGRLLLRGAAWTKSNGTWSFRGSAPSDEVLVPQSAAQGNVAAAWLHPVVVHVAPAPAAALGNRVVAAAARLAGSPYSYGSAGPHAFDCSGLTSYVFGQLGIHLPRTAQAQFDVAHRIPDQAAQPGDLVFFGSPSNIYHVGIYAGHGAIWHAATTGTGVREDQIWTNSYFVGRLT